jgi:long-chain fatty acid transport protein
MKRRLIAVITIIGLACMSASPVLAGGILNKSNLSADYFRSLTRHASIDAADIIAYNPGGVMKLENGIYVKGDILYITKDYTNKVPNTYGDAFVGEDGEFNSDTPSIVPGLFSVYKQDKWAGFFAVTVPGGGGEVDYEDGNARTSGLAMKFINLGGGVSPIQSMKLEANSHNIAYTVGGAYEINSIFSISGGLRYVDAHQEFKGEVDINAPAPYSVDLERNATGWGYFLGANITPMDKLNIGVLYQSNTALDYKSDVEEGDAIAAGVGWGDGTKEREDLPGLVGLGVGYQFTPKLRAEVGYTRYLEDNAEWEGQRFSGEEGDSWEVGLSLTYAFNSKWRASIGYLHTDIVGMEPESLLVEAPALDARTIGIGAVYSPIPRLDISFGYSDVNYDSVTTSEDSDRAIAGTELEKDVTAISFGAQYRF